ncbi:hypothetical protein [Faecalispora jeddahensis]|uniref:hypothetical protein n=1 Tax=Faecalispora jeddahensis TaxID=1414721 RepID=UPI0028B1AD86|nr:hypothetical protein [Faecalispora jeddahensis]
MVHQTKKKILFLSVLAVALVVALVTLTLHLLSINKTDDGKLLPVLGSINVRENDSFSLSFDFLTNNGSNIEFLSQTDNLKITADAENFEVLNYTVEKSSGGNPYIYAFHASCRVQGMDPIELHKLTIQTKTAKYTYDLGKIKIVPYKQPQETDHMKLMSNRAGNTKAGIGGYDAEYTNEGIEPAVIKQIAIDSDFQAFHPQVYLNDQLISDPQNINFSVPPKESVKLLIQFQKKDSPYEIFYFSPTIILESSTELRCPYVISGALLEQKNIQNLYQKYLKS